MAPLPEFKFQRFDRKSAKLDDNYSVPDNWYEISYNDRKLKYTIDILGGQPPLSSGYPLFIGLHGGGTSSENRKDSNDQVIKDDKGNPVDFDTGPKENDDLWQGVWKEFYRLPIEDFYKKVNNNNTSAKDVDKSGVYVALRGVSAGPRPPKYPFTDTYDLHSQPESYVLLEQLIAHLLKPNPPELDQHNRSQEYKAILGKNASAKYFVDPNKIYLMGFSAGGNGAFELGTRISDRLAAVVPSAGHPEGVSFDNVANLPLLLQVGEDDYHGDWRPLKTWEDQYEGGFQRAAVYLDKVVDPLKILIKKRPGCYEYLCQVVKNDRSLRQNPHVYWAISSRVYDTKQNTLKPDKFGEWRTLYSPFPNDQSRGRAFPTFDDINKYYDETIVSPIPWLNGRKRNPTPPYVSWNLLNRPTTPDKVSTNVVWEEKRYFYWLYLRKSSEQNADLERALTENKASYKPEEVWLDTADNAIHIANPNDYMAFLFKEGMLNFANIKVYAHPAPSPPPTITLRPIQTIKDATLAARGHTELQFSAMFYLVKDGSGNWIPKEATTMDG